MAVCTAEADEKPAPRQPNLLLLLADDLRYDAIGANGNSIVQTPKIDQLAARGVSFDRAFVTTSICMISRASIMTGQHVARHGITNFSQSLSPEQLDASYFRRLKQAGYSLGFVGKWGVGAPPQHLFDDNKAYPGQGNYYGYPTTPEKHLTQFLGEQAREFIAAQTAGSPFCLSVSFKAPHVDDGNGERPFNYDHRYEQLYSDVTIPPPALGEPEFFAALPRFLRESENRIRWRQRFASPEMYQESVKSYYRLVTGMDREVGELLAALDRAGLADNTIVIFTSDHGFYLGERGFAGKWYAHDVSLHIPLIIYDPRQPNASIGRSDALALNIDLAPTLLDYASAPIPAAMQGKSLRPIVQDEDPAEFREEFYYEHPFEYATIPQSEAIRTERYKYIVYPQVDPPYEELYDLTQDPDEADNLALRGPSTTLREMRRRFERLRRQVHDEKLVRAAY